MSPADVPPDAEVGREAAPETAGRLSARAKFVLGLGVVMILLGAGIALRPLIPPGRPITSSRLLDVAFAAFFVIRGAMNVRTALRTRTVRPRFRDAGE